MNEYERKVTDKLCDLALKSHLRGQYGLAGQYHYIIRLLEEQGMTVAETCDYLGQQIDRLRLQAADNKARSFLADKIEVAEYLSTFLIHTGDEFK